MKSKLISVALVASIYSYAQTVPKPDHVVILMLENYGYSDIIGNSNAPYINSLVVDANTAVFTQSFAQTHPSQPNYVMLYSGTNQGVTTDAIATNTPWSTCNLGYSLISGGNTFAGYSETLPSVGYTGSTSGSSNGYVRKHAPWVNWQGTGTNQLPASVGQPYTSFPTSTTYSTLPTVSFVIPELDHDMHNPTTYGCPSCSVTAISAGDTWVQNNLTNYITWAKTHNSLLILTFDEDDGTSPNHILTMFIGQQVLGGSYSNTINHYSVLRTLEEMYGITSYCDSSALVTPITNIWRSTTGIEQTKPVNNTVNIWPVPAKQNLNISIGSTNADKGLIYIYDITGRLVKQEDITIKTGDNDYTLDVQNLNSGIYMVKLSSTTINVCKKIVLE
ncbi:MAG: alkaline phosphatase family protein [Bacteroidia bacterium]